MTERKRYGSDVCFCGDYRSQHCRPAPPWRDTSRGGFCFCGCSEFKWGHRATVEDRAHWEKYHGRRAEQRHLHREAAWNSKSALHREAKP